MKTTFFAFTALLLLFPLTGAAFTTTGQRAYRVNDTTALYYIDYAFGTEDHDVYMPIFAVRNQQFGSEAKTIGYEIVQDDDFRTNEGIAQAIVLANLPIENGMYKIPKGYKATLTLGVVLTVEKDAAPAEYLVRVTDLPFYFDNDMNYQRLNPSELQYYETGEVGLNGTKLSDVMNVTVTGVEYSVED